MAPAGLEPVRELLNSWLIPNDSRQPADEFAALARRRGWTGPEAALVRELRDDLRRVVEDGAAEGGVVEGGGAGSGLDDWIVRMDLRPSVSQGELTYRHRGGPAGDLLAAVVAAVGAGTWKRMKACPDCRWVFYDSTRNGSKRWCLMYAGGPDGRACGTIAKVRRYRDRQAAARSVSPEAG